MHLSFPSEPSIASRIDHTLLKAFATEQDICKLCDDAHKYQFASVCVNPIYVRTASKYLRALGSSVKVCTVVGFPLGSTTTECKCFETMEAIANGADEIDMVMAVGMMKNGEYDYVRNEIDRIHTICKNSGKLLKVIIEICYLTDEEIEKASELTFQGGAEFVKTSTGFGPSSATVEAVRIMAKVAKKYGGKVKAAGGIRSRADANAMIEAGAYPFSWFLPHAVTSFMLVIVLERVVELRLWMRAVVCSIPCIPRFSNSAVLFHSFLFILMEIGNP